MSKYADLLTVARRAVEDSMELLEGMSGHTNEFSYCDEFPREMKATADRVLESSILDALRPTNIGILSEESGEEGSLNGSDLRWIVDPLDGTVNFMRVIAPCAVSIGLWKGEKPIFGVVGEYPSGTIWWGGKEFGAFGNDNSLRVSEVKEIGKAVLCTGFPSRFDFSTKSMAKTLQTLSYFGKVRMLGAASLSIVQVAKGSVEVYLERDIMIWDVAAGLAILEGAGGGYKLSSGKFKYSVDIFASNGLIDWEE
jgi:myo-inositol-1(or 4)-monophosphatase